MSEKHKVVEAYYSPSRLSLLLDYSTKWIWTKIKAGEFGPECVMIGDDYRVPASGVNAFLARHHLKSPEPILARTVGELRRKLESPPNV